MTSLITWHPVAEPPPLSEPVLLLDPNRQVHYGYLGTQGWRAVDEHGVTPAFDTTHWAFPPVISSEP